MFYTLDPNAEVKDVKYMIYEMSPETWDKIKTDHLKFRKEVGFRKDYGPIYLNVFNTDAKPAVMYQPEFQESDVLVRIVGKIRRTQVKNMFPHSPIDAEIWTKISEIMEGDVTPKVESDSS